MSRFKKPLSGLSRLSDRGGGRVIEGLPLPLLRQQAFGVTSTVTNNGSVFSLDGIFGYAISAGSGPFIERYAATTPFNFQGAAVTKSADLSGIIGSTAIGSCCLRVHPGGSQIFTLVTLPTIKLVKIGLATPWDISSVSLLESMALPLTTPNNQASHFMFQKDDPSKLIVLYQGGAAGVRLEKYQLVGSYNLSAPPTLIGTRTLTSIGNPIGLDAADDGHVLFFTEAAGGTETTVRRIELPTPWDVTSAPASVAAPSAEMASIAARGITLTSEGAFSVRFVAGIQAVRGFVK